MRPLTPHRCLAMPRVDRFKSLHERAPGIVRDLRPRTIGDRVDALEEPCRLVVPTVAVVTSRS